MSESVSSSSVRGAIPYAPMDPGVDGVLIPGLNGTVRLHYPADSVHPGHEARPNRAALPDAGGIAIRLRFGRLYIVRRPALAAAARGPTSSRFTPAGV
jgi:hypothetical protein